MKRRRAFGLILSAGLSLALFSQSDNFPTLKGPNLGQKPPGMTSELFAPGVISTCLDELNSVFSPDGQEFYFCVRNMGASSVFVMKCAQGVWGRPEPLPFAGMYDDIDVSLSPDGQRLFFCSNRPVSGQGGPKEDHDIWMCERQGGTWGPPVHMGETVNSSRDDFYPIVTKSKTLYFNSQRAGPGTNDIYMCRWVDGKYAPAEKLGPEINTDRREFDAFVAPDESFIILTSQRPEDDPFGDLYISFKTPEGAWTPARNMGKGINASGPEFGTTVSPDGKFLFFTRQTPPNVSRQTSRSLTYDDYVKMHNSPDNGSENIWWVDARIIEELRPKNPEPSGTKAYRCPAAYIEAFNDKNEQRLRDFFATYYEGLDVEKRIAAERSLQKQWGRINLVKVIYDSENESILLMQPDSLPDSYLAFDVKLKDHPSGKVEYFTRTGITKPKDRKASFADREVLGVVDRKVPINDSMIRTSVKEIAEAYDATYFDPETGKRIAAMLKERLDKGEYTQARMAGDLAKKITADVLQLHYDLHSFVEANRRLLPEDSFMGLSENYGFQKTEILDGNIGYIKIIGFSPLKEARPVAGQALGVAANCAGFIFDLRENQGGFPETIQFLSSYFFPGRTKLVTLYDRAGNIANDLRTLDQIPGERF